MDRAPAHTLGFAVRLSRVQQQLNTWPQQHGLRVDTELGQPGCDGEGFALQTLGCDSQSTELPEFP